MSNKRRELEKRLAASREREKATGEILQEKNRALTEALDPQTVTGEILDYRRQLDYHNVVVPRSPIRHRRQVGWPRRWRVAVWMVVACTMVSISAAHAATPEDVLKAYLAAVYARNSPTAYRLISRADRALKPEAEYLREHPSFPGAALAIATALASRIRYEHVQTTIDKDRATVTFNAIVPDANDPAIDALVVGFDQKRLTALSPADRRRIGEQFDELERTGRLPVVVGENERWDLVREDGTWRVFLHWVRALPIHFTAEVKAGLPWGFEAVQSRVLAAPGELLRTLYRVKNRSRHTIVAKARHLVTPPDAERYLEVISCFCFIQQTLAPGESQQLPVQFRVAVDLPKSVRELRVHYEFYPADRFPPSHP